MPLPTDTEFQSALAVGSQYVFAAMVDPETEAELGLFRTSVDTPGSWQHLGFAGERVYSVLLVDESDQELFVAAGAAAGVFRSTDAGVNWELRNAGIELNYVLSLESNGAVPGRIYASAVEGNDSGIYVSSDRGGSWNYWSYCTGCFGRPVQLAIPRDGSETGWMVSYTGFMESWMYRTSDGGIDWEWIPISSGTFPLDLAVNPTDPNEALVLNTFSFWHWVDGSEDHLSSPFDSRSGIGVRMPEWDPGVGYAAGLSGQALDVRRSVSPWTAWEPIGTGLPLDPQPIPADDYPRFQLEAASSRPILALATGNAGVFLLDLGETVSVGPVERPVPGLSWVREFPNPCREFATTTFRLEEADRVRVEIHDVAGRTHRSSPERWFDAGQHVVEWSELGPAATRSGVWFVSVSSSTRRIVQRVVVVP